MQVQMQVQLRFSAPSAEIAEIEQTYSSPRLLAMTLKWWGTTGTRTHYPPDCSGCNVRGLHHGTTTVIPGEPEKVPNSNHSNSS